MDATKVADRILPRRTSAKKAQQSFAEQLDSDDSDGGPTDGLGASATRHSRVSVKRTYSKRAKKISRSVAMDVSKRSGSSEGGKTISPSPEVVSSSVVPSVESVPAGPSSRPRPRPVVKKSGPPLPVLAVVTAPQLLGDEMSPLTSMSSISESGSLVAKIPDPPNSIPSPTAPIPSPSISREPPSSRPFPGPSKAPVWSPPKVGSYNWVLVDKRSLKVYDSEGNDTLEGEEKVWWPAKIDKHGADNSIDVVLFGRGLGTQHFRKPSNDNVQPYLDTSYLPRFSVPKFVIPSSSIIDLTSPRKKPKIDRAAFETKWEDAVRDLKKDRERNSTLMKSSRACEIDEDEDDANDSDASLPGIGKLFNNLYEASLHTTTLSKADISKKKGKRKRSASAEASGHEDAGDFGSVEEDLWTPPDLGCDPGELVLSRDRPSKTVDYWPAKIVEYLPPTNRKQAPRYRVTWLDDTEGIVERSWFYSMGEDGFKTCKLGQFQSSFAEVQNDTDDADTPPDRPRSPSPIIEDPSPSAKDFTNFDIRLQFQYTKGVLKAILANEYQPTRRKHAQYVKDGKSRIEVVKGSGSRGRMDPKEVTLLLAYIKEWCLRDGVRVTQDPEDNTSSTDVDDVLPTDKTPRASPIAVDSLPSSPLEPPPSSLPPSRLEREGSVLSDISHPGPSDTLSIVTEPLSRLDDALYEITDSVALEASDPASQADQRIRVSRDFESLSGLHKEDYCLNILVPEAIRQIFLWRHGQRSSISLLSPVEEEDLYERGEAHMNARDWVFDIMRVRNVGKNPHEQQPQGRALGHNRTSSESRLRKNVLMPNYQE